ncbi:glutathione S-transferase family protein [Luteimonas notoginsengisoli]|uniref:Glutathione S-transferase family protein n=1 Tax=Luteimonas notoginsengisoli TaxID=1578200 RepID=A0ABV7UY40_9GAMM
MLRLYGFSRVNPIAHGRTRDLRVLWALEEMDQPFELVGLDHPAKELNTAAYRAVSPFEQIPVIEDDGLVLSESGAIVLYLARKTGRLIPADAAGAARVERWCFAALNTIEVPLLNLQLMDFVTHDSGANEYRGFLVQWAMRQLGALERWLEGREYVANDDFSVADILLSHVLTETDDPALLDSHPGVREYRERCLSRASWRRTIERYRERVEAG